MIGGNDEKRSIEESDGAQAADEVAEEPIGESELE